MAEASKLKTSEQGNAVVDIEIGARPSPSQRLKGEPSKAFNHESFTIARLPDATRQHARILHEPTMLAIGPYHRKDKHLHAMDAHKRRYLDDFLCRCEGTSSEERREKCKGEIRALEARARRCYFEDFDLSSEEFVDMLLLDGCFIIEFMIKYFYKLAKIDEDIMLRPIWSGYLILSDLIILGNQIPFFVLDVLYNLLLGSERDCLKVDSRSCNLQMLATIVLSNGGIVNVPDIIYNGDFQHLLHLIYTCFIPFPNPWKEEEPPMSCESVVDCLIISVCSPFRWGRHTIVAVMDLVCHLYHCIVSSLETHVPWVRRIYMKAKKGFFWLFPCLRCMKPVLLVSITPRSTIPCATELQEAGIRFKQKVLDQNEVNGFLDISFNSRGHMEIPQLKVYDNTKSMLINLVAFEQCNGTQASGVFTSYAFLMDSLVNTEKDVAVLRSCGVLQNNLSSDEELAEFFNQLSKFAEIPEEYFYQNLVNSVWAYYESKWPKWRAKLVHDYFSNPWSILSLVAAVILLILTFMQTIFTCLAYFLPPS